MSRTHSLRVGRRTVFCFVMSLLAILWAPYGAIPADCECQQGIQAKLAGQVKGYDNGGAPLIPTLLSIADAYDLPMGIEKVTKEALARPATIKLEKGSLSRLLDLCVGQAPGYSWALRDGVVHVFGAKELAEPTNLFNLLVPSFEIREQNLNVANSRLRMTVLFAKERPAGIAGSHLGSSEFDDQRITFAARNVTLREILNSLVRLHAKSAWIARVPPERLSQLPQAGLWQILPHSVHDPTALLEPLQKEPSAR